MSLDLATLPKILELSSKFLYICQNATQTIHFATSWVPRPFTMLKTIQLFFLVVGSENFTQKRLTDRHRHLYVRRVFTSRMWMCSFSASGRDWVFGCWHTVQHMIADVGEGTGERWRWFEGLSVCRGNTFAFYARRSPHFLITSLLFLEPPPNTTTTAFHRFIWGEFPSFVPSKF